MFSRGSCGVHSGSTVWTRLPPAAVFPKARSSSKLICILSMEAFVSPCFPQFGLLDRSRLGCTPLPSVQTNAPASRPRIPAKRPRACSQTPAPPAPERRKPSIPPKTPQQPPQQPPQQHPQPLPSSDIQNLTKLTYASGALGRGVRATLRAFYRRASFVLAAGDSRATPIAPVYVEIGPAYVIATAAQGTKWATRYAVERRAWPALRTLLGWEETETTEARRRGATLRRLSVGGRYGRHVFISYPALAAIMSVAEDLVADDSGPGGARARVPDSGMMGWPDVQLEAMIELRRRPIPGIRTVAAKCPRGAAHKNGDRNPSLLLWMNADGLTGGALCPVCVEGEPREESKGDSGRNMTWRVHYIRGNVAALCTPLRRIRSPAPVTEALDEWRRRQEGGASVARLAFQVRRGAADATPSVVAKGGTREVGKKGREGKSGEPVGGCVMRNAERLGQMGHVMSLAYVTASLKIDRGGSASEMSMGGVGSDGMKLRTVGTKARLYCPMQILLWSDRRSKGPTCARRVEDLSWFARQSLSGGDGDGEDAATRVGADALASEEWLPTGVVSVSAMRPYGWRDVISGNGQLVSVPSGWEAAAQAWVLFDIDDMENLDDEDLVEEAGNKMTLTIRRNGELSGRCLVLQTGPTGLHVWAELREVRENARTWFKREETRVWYADVGAKLLKAAYRGGAAGGKIDMSSCCAGRFARRPGWRLLEDGTAYRARVVTYAAGKVKSRKPRGF